MKVPILNSITRWECPSCGLTTQTTESRPHTEFHECRVLGGITAPLAKLAPGQVSLNRNQTVHKLIEREDYIGSEVGVREIDGQAVMAISVERKDGSNDLAVYAPTATAKTG